MEETMTLSEYINAKIDMLTNQKDFGFELDEEDIAKLQAAQNEIQCDQIAHALFYKYL